MSGSWSRTSSHHTSTASSSPASSGSAKSLFAGLQFVRVQDDVGGPYEGEGGQHPAGGQRLFAPAPGQLRVAQGEFTLTHHLGERAVRQDEFTGGRGLAVLVGQGERTQPGLVAGREVRVAYEREDGVGELVPVQRVLVPDLARVQRARDGGPDLRGPQHGTGGGRQGAQLLQQGVGGVRVGHLQPEPGQPVQDGRGQRVRQRQEDLPGADGGAGRRVRRAREGHGQPGEPVGVDAGQAVVQPPPPVRVTLQSGQPVDGLGERDPGDAERAQLDAALQAGGQQTGEDLGEDPYGPVAHAFDHLGLDGPQRGRPRAGRPGAVPVVPLGRRLGGVPGCGGLQERDPGQPLQDRGPQRAVELSLAEHGRHQRDRGDGHGLPPGEQLGVRVGSALHQEVGQRPRRGVPAGGVQRQRGDQQRRDAEGLVGGGRRVHDGSRTGVLGRPVLADGHRPGHRPVRTQPFLDGPVGQQCGLHGAVGGDGAPAVQAVRGVVDVRVRAVLRAAQRPYAVGGFDDDLVEAGQRQEQRVVDPAEQPAHEVLGDAVAQWQDDDGVVPVGSGALGGQRQPEQRYVSVAAPQLVTEAGAADGGLPREVAGLGEGPADTAVAADHRGLVADGEHGGETDAEAADGRLVALTLGGRPQGAQRFDAGRVERGAVVGGGQDGGAVAVRLVQGEAEPAGDTGAGGGVGGVLGELDDQAVAVAAQREVLLGVGVLTEAGGTRAPGVEHAAPQSRRPERIGPLGRIHAHARTPLFR